MDSFEEFKQRVLLKDPLYEPHPSMDWWLRVAYEAGQASRDAELSELRRKCGQLIEQVAAIKVRLVATTPVIEAAERVVEIWEATGDHSAIQTNTLRAALATYRAAVTKDDQKPSQEEEK